MKKNIDFQSAKQIDIENIPGCSKRFAKLIVKKRKELLPSKLDCDIVCDLIPVKKLSKLCEIFEILVNGACLKTFILQMKKNIDFQSAKQIDIENIPGCSKHFAKLIVKKRKELLPSKLDCDIVCDLIPVKKLSKLCEIFEILVNGACLKTFILQMKTNIDFQSAKQIDIENIPGSSEHFAKLIVKKRKELLPSKLDCDIVL